MRVDSFWIWVIHEVEIVMCSYVKEDISTLEHYVIVNTNSNNTVVHCLTAASIMFFRHHAVLKNLSQSRQAMHWQKKKSLPKPA